MNRLIYTGVSALVFITVLASAGCSRGVGIDSTAETVVASPDVTEAVDVEGVIQAGPDLEQEVSEEEPQLIYTQEKTNIPVRLTAPEYEWFFENSIAGAIAPGLNQGLVPQGMAYYEGQDWMLLSSYRQYQQPSVISVIDMASNKQIKSLIIYEDEETPYTGHAASIAVSEQHLWLTSEGQAFQIDLEDLVNLPDGGHLIIEHRVNMGTKATVSAYADGILWVGEYGREGSHETDEVYHAEARDGTMNISAVVGYPLTEEDTIDESNLFPGTTIPVPSYILSTPQEVQGLTIAGEDIYISASHGLNKASRLMSYRIDWDATPHATKELYGEELPLWYLDSVNLESVITMPPMSEGVMVKDEKVYVWFEAAAQAYRSAPMDEVYALDREMLRQAAPQ